MNEKEEINKIITEKLFGLRIEKCPVQGCNETHSGVYDFCNSDADIREARERIAEKGLQTEFAKALLIEAGFPDPEHWLFMSDSPSHYKLFRVLGSTPLEQARAICRVLEGLDER